MLLACMLSGCALFKQHPEPPPDVGEVNLWLNLYSAAYAEPLPRRVYVFPPLRVDQKKRPVEEYIPVEDELGRLSWSAPGNHSGDIRETVEEEFRSAGFQLVNFDQLLKSEEAHSVLVVTLYHSGGLIDEGSELAANQTADVLFVRLAAGTMPKSLKPRLRRDRINQEILVRMNPEDKTLGAIKAAMVQAVRHFGINREWVETVPIHK